jgi:SAM-dependent methyltransferase
MTPSQRRYPKRACPVCRGESYKLLFRQSFQQFTAGALLEGYDVVICETCGAGFADDIPLQSVFDAYYRDLSKYETGEAASGPQPIDPKFRDAAQTVAPFIPSRDTSVLEIGCASGGLLAALKDLGFTALTGSDPSPACVRATEAYGIPAFTATVFSVPPSKGPYDFLILTGVMEHIADLDHTIDEFRRLLQRGGRIYLEVPDASRYEARLDAPYQEFSVEHINFFSRISLCNLMQVRGFRALDTGVVVRPLHEVPCPCTYGVFENVSEPAPVEQDTLTEPGLRKYIEGCGAEDERIRSILEQALPAGSQVIVWGTGTHTLRLLATGGLDPERVAVFVDSNPKYRDQMLSGVPVVGPEAVRDRPEPILISSRNCERDIHDQIRYRLALRNPIIMLYGHQA